MTNPLVICTMDDGVAQVRMARPDKLNALTLETLTQLVDTARGLRRDKTLRAVVLAGEGDSFCAGLDFGSVLASPTRIARAFVPMPWRGTNLFQEACWAWRRLPVPVIAAVHGHCLGGGLQIALAADFRFATADSTWSVLEGKWGLIPDMSGIRSLAELTGMDVAKRLTMTAESITGEEAHRWGLVTEVVTDPVAEANDFAQRLMQRSPRSGSSMAPGRRARGVRSPANASSKPSYSRLETLPWLAGRPSRRSLRASGRGLGKTATGQW
jgi:enoyl-CoA hydratase/carnithine racemase